MWKLSDLSAVLGLRALPKKTLQLVFLVFVLSKVPEVFVFLGRFWLVISYIVSSESSLHCKLLVISLPEYIIIKDENLFFCCLKLESLTLPEECILKLTVDWTTWSLFYSLHLMGTVWSFTFFITYFIVIGIFRKIRNGRWEKRHWKHLRSLCQVQNWKEGSMESCWVPWRKYVPRPASHYRCKHMVTRFHKNNTESKHKNKDWNVFPSVCVTLVLL